MNLCFAVRIESIEMTQMSLSIEVITKENDKNVLARTYDIE